MPDVEALRKLRAEGVPALLYGPPGTGKTSLVEAAVPGLITVAGARIWVDNKVNFADSRNMLVAAITLVLGTGDFTLKFGGFAMGGIGTATFGAILLNALLSRGRG